MEFFAEQTTPPSNINCPFATTADVASALNRDGSCLVCCPDKLGYQETRRCHSSRGHPLQDTLINKGELLLNTTKVQCEREARHNLRRREPQVSLEAVGGRRCMRAKMMNGQRSAMSN